jgi:hypothetical protein
MKFSVLWFQVNAVMGELFASEILGQTIPEKPQSPNDPGNLSSSLYKWSTGL